MPESSDLAWVQYESEGKFYLACIHFHEKSIESGLLLPEERLVMHSASKQCIVFRRFPRRDWPVAGGIAGWEPSTKRFFVSEKASPLHCFNEQHWLVQYEGEGTLLMNVLDGSTYEMKEATTPKDVVVRYSEGNPYYAELQSFLHQQLSLSAIGPLEYSESEGCFGVSFHVEQIDKTFNTVTVFWNQEGKIIQHENCFSALRGLSDALMMGNSRWLLYLKNESELVFIPWKQ